MLTAIEATPTRLKLIYENGSAGKYCSYIEALNQIVGYGITDGRPIEVWPQELCIPVKNANAIVAKLYEYFHVVLGYEPEWHFDVKNGEARFDVFGKSTIKLVKK